MSSTTISPQARRGFAIWNRKLAHYPERAQRLRSYCSWSQSRSLSTMHSMWAEEWQP
jgi:hypothetical protein